MGVAAGGGRRDDERRERASRRQRENNNVPDDEDEEDDGERAKNGKARRGKIVVVRAHEKGEKQDGDGDRLSEVTASDDVEWEPPEGGWGCMIVVGFSVMFIVTAGPMSNFGMIFKDFFEKFGDGTSGITLINGVYNAVVSFTGFFTSFTLKRFSMRQVGILGSLLYSLGTLLTVFTISIPYLVFSVGVLQGAGFGIMMPISMTAFNNYFVKKRVAYMGVASVLVGCGVMAFPSAIKFLMEQYGFRGTLIVLSGVSFHTIVAMAVMQPIEWHLVPVARRASLSSSTAGTDVTHINGDLSPMPRKEIDPLLDVGDLAPLGKSKRSLSLTGSSIRRASLVNSRKASLVYAEIFGSCKEIVSVDHRANGNGGGSLCKASSIASLGNWAVPTLVSEAVATKSGTWQTLINSFDLKLLKDPRYSNICLGTSFVFFSDITFFILEPTMLYHYGFSQAEVALVMTAGAGSDLIMRVIFAVFTFKYSVNSRTVFFIGTCCIAVLRIVFVQYDEFIPVLILTTFLGAFRSWLHIFLPLVFAENCANDQFPVAYGLFMMISGIITFLMSVIVGFLRDYTNSFKVAFHFLTLSCFILIIPWSMEFYYNYKSKRKSTK